MGVDGEIAGICRHRIVGIGEIIIPARGTAAHMTDVAVDITANGHLIQISFQYGNAEILDQRRESLRFGIEYTVVPQLQVHICRGGKVLIVLQLHRDSQRITVEIIFQLHLHGCFLAGHQIQRKLRGSLAEAIGHDLMAVKDDIARSFVEADAENIQSPRRIDLFGRKGEFRFRLAAHGIDGVPEQFVIVGRAVADGQTASLLRIAIDRLLRVDHPVTGRMH